MDVMNRKMDGMGRMGPTETKVIFTPPPSLELEGDSGEAMVKWRRAGDKIEITSVNGVSLSGEKESTSDDSNDVADDSEMA